MNTEFTKGALSTFASEKPAVSGVISDALNGISATQAAGISAVASCTLASSGASITALARETARKAGVNKISSFIFNTGKPLCPSVR